MPISAAELVEQLYERWNECALADVDEQLDPDVELVCDPLRPRESTLSGRAGWQRWAARWSELYASMRVTADALIALDDEHVLAFVTIAAVQRDGGAPRSWAAAHLWTVRDGRVARWETHLDLGAARATLL